MRPVESPGEKFAFRIHIMDGVHGMADVRVEMECPVCGQKFSASLPFAGLDFDYRESDLKPVFVGGQDPFPALIQVCPSCQFAAYPQTFGCVLPELEELMGIMSGRIGDRRISILVVPERPSSRDREVLSRTLSDMLKGSNVPQPAMKYILAARCHDFFAGRNNARIADYFLRGLWAARAARQPAVERAFCSAAIERFRELASDELLIEGERVRFAFLQAELARRSGNFIGALNIFSQVQERGLTPSPGWTPETAFFGMQSSRLVALASIRSAMPAKLWEPETDEELAAEMGEISFLKLERGAGLDLADEEDDDDIGSENLKN